MRRLKTAKQVVVHLGGLQRVADLTEADIRAAENWPTRFGRFPADTYCVMQKALRRRNATAHPRLWRMRGFQ